MPFLAKLRAELKIAPERLIPITRGGAAAWYGTPTGIELYGMRTPQDVRIENRVQLAKHKQLKQTHVTAFDRQVLRDVADTLGLRHPLTLHPAWLYQTFAPFWAGATGLQWLQTHTQFGSLPVAPLPAGVTLPPQFVAVRFYFRPTFPPAPQTVQFAIETIKQIAATQPVVLLNNGLHMDDHVDVKVPVMPNVTRLSDLCTLTPETNLLVQSAVLARALGFVGTYGGLAQLALRYGKPSVSVYQEWAGTAIPHKHLSEALALQLGIPFAVVRVGDLPLLQQALPRVMMKSPPDVAVPSPLVSV